VPHARTGRPHCVRMASATDQSTTSLVWSTGVIDV
jgi:hypothetical protein